MTEDVRQEPRRWIVDFAQMTLEAARRYPLALTVVESRVREQRESSGRDGYRQRWWQFGEPRVGLRTAIAELERSIVVNRLGKRSLFAWKGRGVVAGDLVNVLAFDDDYSMGVLTSRAHGAWARSASSTLETRFRYTPTSVFETFVWPDPVTDSGRAQVSDSTRDLLSRRADICTTEQIGLTKLYNRVDDGAYADLVALHRRLDEAVAAAYGWPKSVAKTIRSSSGACSH